MFDIDTSLNLSAPKIVTTSDPNENNEFTAAVIRTDPNSRTLPMVIIQVRDCDSTMEALKQASQAPQLRQRHLERVA
jgi:hypothetical protein